MEKKRLDYLDMVKGIGILLVVIGHMQDISTGLRVWISSFHMPLFFIVSGILMAVKNEPDKNIKESIYKKFKGIIIPYLWFSLSYFVIDIGNVTVIGNIDKRTFIVDTISSLTFYGMSVLWFLPALFLASIFFIMIAKMCNIYLVKLKSELIIVVSFIISIIIAILAYVIKLQVAKLYDNNADSLLITSLINIIYIFLRALISMSFVAFGYCIRRIYEKLISIDAKYKIIDNRIFCLVVGMILLAINIVLGMKNECVDLHNMLLNNVPLYYCAAFSGTLAMINICKALPVVKLVTYYGRNSIIVMACHINYYILYAGIKFAWVVDAYVTRAKHYVFVIVTMVTVFVLSTIVIEGINRLFPFVLGRPIRHKK